MTLRGEGREGGRLSQVENPVVRGEILGEKIVVNIFLFYRQVSNTACQSNCHRERE